MFRNPSFTLTGSLVVALVIGANGTVFSFADHILLKQLPYSQPDRLVRIWETNEEAGGNRFAVSPGSFVDWHDSDRFSSLGALYRGKDGILKLADEDVSITTASMTPGLLPTLGVVPIHGRSFTLDEGAPVALISHSLWRRIYHRDPGAVGDALDVDGRRLEIVGILPRDNRLLAGVDIWLPMTFRHTISRRERGTRYLDVTARLAPERSLTEARVHLSHIQKQAALEFPASHQGWDVDLRPLHDSLVENVRPTLMMLSLAAGLVLGLGCFNFANILLAHSLKRQKESAIRMALGIRRSRLTRLFLMENLLIAFFGGTLGIALTLLGMHVFAYLLMPGTLEDFAFNMRNFGFSLVLSLLCAVVPGWAQAARSSRRSNVFASLREVSGSSGGSRHFTSTRFLVGLQIAMASSVLIVTGLLVRSLESLLEVDPGFSADHLYTVQIDLPRVGRASDFIAPVNQIIEEYKQIPGVRHAAIAMTLPLNGKNLNDFITLPHDSSEERWPTLVNAVSWEYFTTLGIPLVSGDSFNHAISAGSEQVAIVNEALAERFWPQESAVGQFVRVSLDRRDRRIIGVVGNVRTTSLATSAVPEIYLPRSQFPSPNMWVVLRVETTPPANLLTRLRSRARSLYPTASVLRLRPMSKVISATVASSSFTGMMMASFSAIAAILAATGIYGVVSLSVRRRTSEVGVRMACGANPQDIVMMFLKEAFKTVSAGLVLGAIIAYVVAQYFDTLLFGMSAFDPTSYAIAMSIVVATTIATAYLPARRIRQLDVAATLKSG